MLTSFYEVDEVQMAVREYVQNQLEYANTCGSNEDERLDHMAHVIRMKFPNLWTYRGGNHVAVHIKGESGRPEDQRMILIHA